jgi:hypothetical protein
MPDFDPRYLLLIPFTLAEAFLLWAIWQLQKQLRKPKNGKSRLTGFRP